MPDLPTLRGVYGKPLAKAAGQKIVLTEAQLREMGEIILESIKEEIAKDTAKAMGLAGTGEPVAIPRTKKFAESFSVKVKGASTLIITSDWPSAESHVSTDPKDKNPQATKPFPMTWLSKPKVPYARIVRSNGEVIVRATPDLMKGEKYWIHPGFRRYSFLERGIRKGREKAIAVLSKQIVEGLLSKFDLFG